MSRSSFSAREKTFHMEKERKKCICTVYKNTTTVMRFFLPPKIQIKKHAQRCSRVGLYLGLSVGLDVVGLVEGLNVGSDEVGVPVGSEKVGDELKKN